MILDCYLYIRKLGGDGIVMRFDDGCGPTNGGLWEMVCVGAGLWAFVCGYDCVSVVLFQGGDHQGHAGATGVLSLHRSDRINQICHKVLLFLSS